MSEQIRTENYRPNQRLRVYIHEVERTSRGPRIRASRTHQKLLFRLLESEVPEIFEGTVEIRSQDPSIKGVLILKAGETIVVYEGQDPSLLEPVPNADYSGLPDEAGVVTTIETRTIDSILTPSIVITPPVDVAPEQPSPTPVIVDVVFPDNRIQQ